MATLGTPGSATYAVSLSGISEMVSVLPDNLANQIMASDVRNVVLTLYDQISTLTASLPAPVINYTNPNKLPNAVGGVPAQSTFATTLTVQQVLDRLFYPYVGPSCSFSVKPNVIEFGSSQTVLLNWTIRSQVNPILFGNINRPNNAPNPYVIPVAIGEFATASGTIAANPIPNTTSIFTFSVSDYDVSDTPPTGQVYSFTASLTYSHRRYWGRVSSTASFTLSSQILGLNGAGVGAGSELSATRVQNRDGINGAGQYLAFSWPSSYGTPSFVVNGVINTAFTRINNNFSFTNNFGYTHPFEVWVSNQIYNSPLNTFQIN